MTGITVLDHLSDWLYQHSTELHVIFIIAVAIALVGSLTALLRRDRMIMGLAIALPAMIAIGGVLVAEVMARRSNARDIAMRIHQVAVTLPLTGTRTGVTLGDNFQIETYRVAGDSSTVARAVEASMHAAFGHPGATGMDNAVGGSSAFLTVSFLGRSGCDGSVDVRARSIPANGATTIEITGHCED